MLSAFAGGGGGSHGQRRKQNILEWIRNTLNGAIKWRWISN
jgi:hypothetical protein